MKKLIVAAALVTLPTVASAADLGARRIAVPAAIVAPVFSWTGFYVGLNAGYGFANTNINSRTDGFLPGSGGGFVGGGQIGYNYQINNIVLGVEGDFGYFGVRRSASVTDGRVTVGGRWQTNWDASVRARLGVAVDRTLFYVTGGVAFTDLSARASLTSPVATQSISASHNRVGWTVGAGIEHAFAPNWTARAEYLYANYGSKALTFNFGGQAEVSQGIRLETHKFRVGVNYLFSTGGGPIVARY